MSDPVDATIDQSVPQPRSGEDIATRAIWSPCDDCRHLNWPESVNTCSAFPTGIPLAIRLGRHRHDVKYPGDHGIQRDPLPPSVPADGPVTVRAVLDPQGLLVGHLFWQDGAEGFLPVGSDFDAHHTWRGKVRRAQRGGARVSDFADYLTTAPGEGQVYAIGPPQRRSATGGLLV